MSPAKLCEENWGMTWVLLGHSTSRTLRSWWMISIWCLSTCRVKSSHRSVFRKVVCLCYVCSSDHFPNKDVEERHHLGQWWQHASWTGVTVHELQSAQPEIDLAGPRVLDSSSSKNKRGWSIVWLATMNEVNGSLTCILRNPMIHKVELRFHTFKGELSGFGKNVPTL